LILVGGQGLLYTWLLFYQKAYLETSLHDEMSAIARHIAATAPAEIADQRSLDQVLSLLLRTGSVLSSRIVDGEGRTLASKTAPRPDAGESGPVSRWVFSIPEVNTVRVPMRMDGGTTGTVEVTYSGKRVNDVMGRFLVIPPIMQIMTFLVVIYAILRFFRRKVSSPVASINAAMGRITEGDLAAEVPDIGDNEIGSIATGARFLAEKLSTTLSRFNSLSNDVVAVLDQLTNVLSVVRDTTRNQAAAIDRVISIIRTTNEQQREAAESTDRLSASPMTTLPARDQDLRRGDRGQLGAPVPVSGGLLRHDLHPVAVNAEHR
jgi:methyl-accepting chemotaxis protein